MTTKDWFSIGNHTFQLCGDYQNGKRLLKITD